jgi:hypothetical protein
MSITILRQSLADIAAELEHAKREAAEAQAYARLKREKLDQVRDKMRARMAGDGIEAFTDAQTGIRYWISTIHDIEIVDQDRVFVALYERGRSAHCTRLDARAVKKEAKVDLLEGTIPTVTRALRSRRKKGA